MMHNLRFSGFGSTNVVNYDKKGQPFLSSIEIQPIISENHYGEFSISHYLGVIKRSEIDTIATNEYINRNNSYYDFSIQSKEKDAQDEAYDWVMNDDAISITITDEDEDLDDVISICSVKITDEIKSNSDFNSDDYSDKSATS